MNTHVFSMTAFVLSVTVLTGCGSGESDSDTGAPKPPPSGVDVDGAMSKPASGTTADSRTTSPDFDTSTLPGLNATDWTTTPGGSWYATVTPGLGTTVDTDTGSVTVIRFHYFYFSITNIQHSTIHYFIYIITNTFGIVLRAK